MIYTVINSCVYVILANLFFKTFLNEIRCRRICQLLFSLLWVIYGIVISTAFPENLMVRIFLSLGSNVLYSLLLFDRKIVIKNIVVAILFYILVIESDMFAVSIQKRFDPDLIVDHIMREDISIYMGTVSQLLQMIIVLVINKIFKPFNSLKIGSKMWILYLIFPMYSMSLIILIAYGYDGPINRFQMHSFNYVASSLLVSNIFVYWFIKQEQERILERQKNEFQTEQTEKLKILYEQSANERKILGKREHEYKNIIATLYRLSKEKKYEDIYRLLKTQNTELMNGNAIVETGNNLISAILNAMYAEARSKNISVRFILDNLSELHMDDRSCVIIFSNILRNAIEAAECCPEDNRYIRIKAVVEEREFIFSVHNSSVTGGMTSRKEDVVSHGYGLQNIKEEVERINGECYFESQRNEFISVIIIPL